MKGHTDIILNIYLISHNDKRALSSPGTGNVEPALHVFSSHFINQDWHIFTENPHKDTCRLWQLNRFFEQSIFNDLKIIIFTFLAKLHLNVTFN